MTANHSEVMITFTDRQFDVLLSQMSRLYADVRSHRLPNRTYNTARMMMRSMQKKKARRNRMRKGE